LDPPLSQLSVSLVQDFFCLKEFCKSRDHGKHNTDIPKFASPEYRTNLRFKNIPLFKEETDCPAAKEGVSIKGDRVVKLQLVSSKIKCADHNGLSLHLFD